MNKMQSNSTTLLEAAVQDELLVFPLSYAQQRLWFLDQLETGNPAFNVCSMFRLRGTLDEKAFQAAIQEIVDRHEALRTTFAVVDGEPSQVVAQRLILPVTRHDVSSRPDSARNAAAMAHADAAIRRPFDLARGPLLRVELVRIARDEHLFVFVAHHIVFDGWSWGILLAELSRSYAAERSAHPSPLPELTIQYPDYAVWQREWLQENVLEDQLRYWKKILQDVPPPLELPRHLPLRDPVSNGRGEHRTFELPSGLLNQIQGLAREENATLFMVMLSAYATLLYRYTGQDDLVVGAPVASRTRAEIEGLIGCFMNPLPLRLRLNGRKGFREILRCVREACLGAFANQDAPFDEIVRALGLKRDLATLPLFQVMFLLQDFYWQRFELAGLDVERVIPEGDILAYPLSLDMGRDGENLVGRLEYLPQFAHLAGEAPEHLMALLESALHDPEQAIELLPILGRAERRKILVDWQGERADAGDFASVHELFEAQVERAPDRVAVKFGSASLTYAEVNCRANQLAHLLQEHGVKPESRVGVLLERGEQMPIAIMAVLKAGGAYVPLDPRYPQERLRYILRDADVNVLITQTGLRHGGTLNADHVICLDSADEALVRRPVANPHCGARGDHLAYLIYTSGSTGAPKGTMIERRSVVNAYLAWERSYRLREDTHVHLQMASMSFDVFTGDLARALFSGGTLIIAPHEMLLAPQRLYELMQQESVDCAEFVPVVFRELLDYLGHTGQSLAFMRLIAVGSDLWYVHEFRRALSFCGPQTRLVNSYGLTEATIDSTWYEADSELPAEGLVPIGRPFANTELYILDSCLQPVPIGVAGDLYIGGPGLARGYLNQPELTREKFVHHPFRDEPGARLYRTGDRAHWLRNGCVQFLGRADNQVKLRGFRIELAEIESLLIATDGVLRAAVIVREDVPADQRLVAYVVPREGEAPSAAHLRSLLSARLPEQMLPSAFVFLPTMPLTPNGKVDRNALPAPEPGASDAGADYVPASSPVEEALAALYAELLKSQRVGAHDDFFLLGGHSLLATRLVSRIRETFDVELPLRSLFESAVVRDLARDIERRISEEARPVSGAVVPPIEPADRSGEIELSFAQQRMWFLQQLEAESIAYHLPSVTRLRGSLDISALRRTFQRIAERHETLRTVFRQTDGRATQVILPDAVVPLTVIDLTYVEPADARELEAERQTSEALARAFDFAKPLWRVTLLRLAHDEHVLVFVAHHAISDGWSMEVFVREFETIYRAILQSKHDGLLPLRVQYADYAIWQRRQMTAELDRQLTYWGRKLAGAPLALHLPTDRPRPPRPSGRGARYIHRLDDTIVAAVTDLARANGSTQFIALFTAFNVLLHRYTGQCDILVGSPVANRTRREIENLIGFFANTLVYRTDITGDPSFTELLARVRRTALEAYSNQDLPFERLVNELKIERDLSLTPLFQVMFVLQDSRELKFELPDLSFEMIPVRQVTTKFDITLTISQTPRGAFAELVYSTDLFDHDTITRLANRFETLLRSIVADPAATVTALNLVPDDERDALLRMSTGPVRDYSFATTLHELISDRAQKYSERIAAADEREHITYTELERRTAALARHLRSLGVRRGDRVGICVERSVELLVSVLAVMKAGAGYLPLDPDYPPKRLRMMLTDAEPLCVIAHAPTVSVLDCLRAEERAQGIDRLVRVDRPDTWAVSDQLAIPPDRTGGPDDSAYVLYTSGSTGKPKGVINHHRGIINRLLGMQEAFELKSDDVIFQKTPAGFDVSVWEFFWPLLVGSRLFFARPDGHRDPQYLAETIIQRQVTTIHFVPSMLRAFLEGVSRDLLARCAQTLRRVLCGGEAMSLDLQQLFFERLPGVELHNQYGPTEAAVDVTHHVCRPGATRSIVPIGKPVQNVQIHILDAHMRPLPLGLPGELHIGGVQLATGYLGRPDLTAERFVSDPFDRSGRGRLYKSGDLARWTPDGEVEFLGRLDHQVKIRGQRIEPAEIELALMTLSLKRGRLRQAAVAAETRGGADDAHLVAYLVMEDAAFRPPAEDLRNALAAVLPNGWIPSRFIFLDALPIGPTGKLDRRALPQPSQAVVLDDANPDSGGYSPSTLRQAYVAPRTPVESALAEVWCQVLKLPRIGIHDNFFAIGGDSIISIQIIARAKAAGMKIVPRDMFQRQTIAELAEVVTAPATTVVETKAHGTQPPRPTVQPLMFGPSDALLYGCFHPPAGRSDGTAVLICQPVGYEFVRCHRCLRNLAQRLAARGVPVLRFDYMGCGDSVGDAEDASLEAWLASVSAASMELRRRTDVRRLVVVGLRLGATLAAAASAKGLLNADSLVLWQPYIRGQSSLDESQAAHERHTAWSAKEFGKLPTGVPPEQLGYRWSQQLMNDLQQLNLLQLPAPASRRALIVGNAEEPAFTPLARHLTSGGSRVETAHVPEPGIWDAEPYLAAMPHASVERIISWINRDQS